MTTRRQAVAPRPPERANPYFVCGVIGYLAGLAMAMAAALNSGMAAPSRLIVATVPVTTLLVSVRVNAMIVGSERIVFLENAVLAAVTTAVALAMAGERIVPGIDTMILGVGVFQIFARIGCFRVGCCHGRPCRVGVRYGAEHVRTGFPAALVGVRLAPVQLADAALNAVAVAAAATARWRHPDLAGEPTVLYATIYAAGRFCLELVRGDRRPYLAGLSEAQWTGLAISWAAALWRPGWIVTTAAVGLTSGAVLLVGRHALRRSRHRG